MKRTQTFLTGTDGSPYVSTNYWGDTPTVQQVIDATANLWNIYDSYMVDNCFWSVDPVVVTVDPTTGEITESESGNGANGQGASAVEMLPPHTQILVRWRTGFYAGGREIRGRTFIPALADTVNLEGNVSTTTATALTTALNTWILTAPNPLIWSRVTGQTAAVINASIWTEFAVLRSRRD